jgi:hypothetical protein
MTIEVTTFGAGNGGTIRRQISTGRGVTVLVSPTTNDDNAAAEDMTSVLAAFLGKTERAWTQLEQRCREAEQFAERLEALTRKLEARVPPPSPERMLGPACIRFDDRGRLWVLNKRETGWASFGVIMDGWDDLFRRYAVRITEHSTDECGSYWMAVPA